MFIPTCFGQEILVDGLGTRARQSAKPQNVASYRIHSQHDSQSREQHPAELGQALPRYSGKSSSLHQSAKPPNPPNQHAHTARTDPVATISYQHTSQRAPWFINPRLISSLEHSPNLPSPVCKYHRPSRNNAKLQNCFPIIRPPFLCPIESTINHPQPPKQTATQEASTMAVGIRSIAGLTSIILIGGSIVLMFFVVLSGYKDIAPLNKTYFLRADTSSFTPAGRPVSQWTYFYVCGEGNQDCGSPVPDLPVGYAWLDRENGVPEQLLGSHGKGTTSTYYYYMWRFGWVFYLIALLFACFGFLSSLLAPFSRLASGLSGLILGTALFFMSLAAALMTVTFVKMRNVFRSADISARIGRYAFGFTWGAWAAMFLAMVLLFLGCGLGGGRKDKVSNERTFFRRQRSRRSARGSFVDNDSGRRVKEEYS